MPPHQRAVEPVLPLSKFRLIPAEILYEIFQIIISPHPLRQWKNLMLECRGWHAILISIPGIHSYLKIRRATQKEEVEQFMQGRRSRLHVIVDMNDAAHGKGFNADNFHASFMAAAMEASRWSSLQFVSFPPPMEYQTLQVVQPLEHLESFTLAQGCDLGNFFEPLMTAITTTATSRFTNMYLGDPDTIIYLLQPACLHVFSFLTILTVWLAKKMESPVDILPHLYRLQSFNACHLSLPIYPPGTHLPFVQTLCDLILRSVSIQWVAGQVFPALENCIMLLPHHADTIQAISPATMPSCKILRYRSNDLGPLGHFIHPPLTILEVESGQWSVWRGNLQLALMQPTFAASGQKLTILQLHVQCSGHLLIQMLRLVPALERLDLRLNSPHALSEAFFLAFVARKLGADDPCKMVGVSSQDIAPLCGSLWDLRLYYKRWLRGRERTALVPVFGDIIASRGFRFSLELI